MDIYSQQQAAYQTRAPAQTQPRPRPRNSQLAASRFSGMGDSVAARSDTGGMHGQETRLLNRMAQRRAAGGYGRPQMSSQMPVPAQFAPEYLRSGIHQSSGITTTEGGYVHPSFVPGHQFRYTPEQAMHLLKESQPVDAQYAMGGTPESYRRFAPGGMFNMGGRVPSDEPRELPVGTRIGTSTVESAPDGHTVVLGDGHRIGENYPISGRRPRVQVSVGPPPGGYQNGEEGKQQAYKMRASAKTADRMAMRSAIRERRLLEARGPQVLAERQRREAELKAKNDPNAPPAPRALAMVQRNTDKDGIVDWRKTSMDFYGDPYYRANPQDAWKDMQKMGFDTEQLAEMIHSENGGYSGIGANDDPKMLDWLDNVNRAASGNPMAPAPVTGGGVPGTATTSAGGARPVANSPQGYEPSQYAKRDFQRAFGMSWEDYQALEADRRRRGVKPGAWYAESDGGTLGDWWNGLWK